MEKKVITADSASELNKKIEKYAEEGWETIGSHKVVEIHRQNRFRGSELVDTIIKSEYSITIQLRQIPIGTHICTLFVPDPKTGTSPKCIYCGKSEIDHLKIF
jgi:hypothetical protein